MVDVERAPFSSYFFHVAKPKMKEEEEEKEEEEKDLRVPILKGHRAGTYVVKL